MILSHNLTLSGVRVTTFSTILCELRGWFPGHDIRPFHPKHPITSFDQVITADHAGVKYGTVLEDAHFDKQLTMVENLRLICEERLQLPHVEIGNGITPPPGVAYRKYPNRVVIHPLSADYKKNWPAHKYRALSALLKEEGFEPVFCVAPHETKQFAGTAFDSVDALARFVFESGWMIGNDSGVGHLASALHIPTLSLFARKSYSNLWRPGWGPGEVVTPPPVLPGSRLKEKHWKELLSVQQVFSTFKKQALV